MKYKINYASFDNVIECAHIYCDNQKVILTPIENTITLNEGEENESQVSEKVIEFEFSNNETGEIIVMNFNRKDANDFIKVLQLLQKQI